MTDMTGVIGKRRFSAPSPAFQPEEDGLLRDRKGRIRTKDPSQSRTIKYFFDCFSGTGRSVHVSDEP